MIRSPKITFMLLLLLLAATRQLSAQLRGDEWTSPNGHLTLKTRYVDDGLEYKIINNKTKKISAGIPLLTRLLYLKWTDDDNTIIVVEHLAGCELARMLTFDNRKWMVDDVYPPGPWPNFFVVDIQPHQDSVTFKYKVMKDNGDYFGVCEFKYSIKSGKISDVSDVPVSLGKFEALKPLGWPK